MSDNEPKIYLLPNLMTAGNLFCGFMAVLTIFKGIQLSDVAELSADGHGAQEIQLETHASRPPIRVRMAHRKVFLSSHVGL